MHSVPNKFFVVLSLLLLVGVKDCDAQNVTVSWQGQQLGTALERLAGAGSVALWLDRRVDLSQLVDETYSNVPVREAMAALAAKHGVAAIDLEHLIYVGPQETAHGLAALLLEARADAGRGASSYRSKWLKPRDITWPRLSEPRSLLETTFAQAGIEIEGLEQVPHDLWPEREFSQLSLVDQTVLTLAGFDLTCEITAAGRRCRVIPIEYPLPDRSRELFAGRTQRKKPTKQKLGSQQFSLKLTNQPVGRVVEQLGFQLNLNVVWDEPSLARQSRSKDTLVSCEVKNTDLEGLLMAILKPAGMNFTLEDMTLTVDAQE